MPSSTATSVAHAVIGLEIDASRCTRSRSPIVATTVPARSTAALTCSTGQRVVRSRAVTAVDLDSLR